MDKQLIINSFKKYDIELHPAGIWEFDTNGKKRPKVAYRIDGLNIDDYPDDNMFKLRIEKTPYLVIDVDGGDIGSLYQMFPSIAKTLTTTTTADNKFHIYIQRPEEFPLTRIVNALPKIDILSNGIVFEGHLYNINEYYDIEGRDIVELTEDEIMKLRTYVPRDIKYTKPGVKYERRSDPEELHLIEDYLKDTLTNPERLWNKLSIKDEVGSKKQGRPTGKVPELSYDRFNLMSYWIAINQFIPHNKVISFLEKVLVKEYNINLDTQQTQQRFYKQIVPTLPIIEVNYFDSWGGFVNKLPISDNGQWKLVGTTLPNSGTSKASKCFIAIDKYTNIPYRPNGSLLLDRSWVNTYFQTLQPDHLTMLDMVEITENPYLPKVSRDVKTGVFTLSTLEPTEYIVNLAELPVKPNPQNNVIAKAIEGVFCKTEEMDIIDIDRVGNIIDPVEFYYHWLAHILFSTKQLKMVMSLVTGATVLGGTGKTILTLTLPELILPIGAVAQSNESTAAKWDDDFYDKKLTTIDDMKDLELWKKELFARIKQLTSGSGSITMNRKGKGISRGQGRIPSLAITANFIPTIEDSDRRIFMWAPQHKLEGVDALDFVDIIESPEYHNEIQEVANYCYYLFNNHRDKYRTELYAQAPRTTLYRNARAEGAIGPKLLSIIKAGPDKLFSIFMPTKKSALTHHEIAELIVNQSTLVGSKYSISMPQQALRIIYDASRADDFAIETSAAKLANALNCGAFNRITKEWYREHYPDWVQNGVTIKHVDEEIIDSYKLWLKQNNKPTSKKEGITIEL